MTLFRVSVFLTYQERETPPPAQTLDWKEQGCDASSHQPHWIWSHLGDTSLDVSVRVSPVMFT